MTRAVRIAPTNGQRRIVVQTNNQSLQRITYMINDYINYARQQNIPIRLTNVDDFVQHVLANINIVPDRFLIACLNMLMHRRINPISKQQIAELLIENERLSCLAKLIEKQIILLENVIQIEERLNNNRDIVSSMLHCSDFSSTQYLLNEFKALTFICGEFYEYSLLYGSLDNFTLALKSNTTVTKVTFKDYILNKKEANWIADALISNTTIKTLIINGCEFDRAHLNELSSAIKINTSLEKLDLRNNWLEPKHAKILANALRTNTTLTTIKFDWSEKLTKSERKILTICKANKLLSTNKHKDALEAKELLEKNHLQDTKSYEKSCHKTLFTIDNLDTLLTHSTFFRNNVEKRFLIENRGKDENIQHEYDKRFGLI